MRKTESVFATAPCLRFSYLLFLLASVLSAQSTRTLAASGNVKTALRSPTNRDGLGPHWRVVNSGLPTATVGITALTVDPLNPSTLYVCTSHGDLFKSTDGAASWAPIDGVGDVRALTIDPQNSSTLYVVGLGIVKSVDGGKHWASRTGSLANTSVLNLFVDPITPSTLYALTTTGVFKSTDGGGTWNAKTTGLSEESQFQFMTLDPTNPSNLYAVDVYGAIFKTWDGGDSWSAIHAGSSGFYAASLAIDPVTPSIIYAGSFVFGGRLMARSTDGGITWAEIGNGIPSGAFVSSLAIDPVTPSTIYALTNTGAILKSVDAGASWISVTVVPLIDSSIGALSIDPKAPTTIYTGYFDTSNQTGALLKSSDGGQTWNAADAGLASVDVRFLTPDPINSSTIYAGGTGGLSRSVDAGSTWTLLGAFQLVPFLGYSRGAAVRSLTIDPVDTQLLYATLTSVDGSCYFADQLVRKSTDGGASWDGNLSPSDSGCSLGSIGEYPPPAAASPSGSTLYVGETDDLDGFYQLDKSVDGGTTWNATWNWQSGLSAGIAALAIDPTVPTTLYAGTDDSPSGGRTLFKSTDGGTTWNSIGIGSAATNVLAIDPNNPSVLYAGVEGHYTTPRGFGGLFKSTDGGATWSAINNGLDYALDTNCRMTSLVLDPTNTNVLYAGTAGAGVFMSVDGGASWEQLNNGLENLDIRALAVPPSGVVYAATSAGVFKLVQRKLGR